MSRSGQLSPAGEPTAEAVAGSKRLISGRYEAAGATVIRGDQEA
jgi:hypothetical protein